MINHAIGIGIDSRLAYILCLDFVQQVRLIQVHIRLKLPIKKIELTTFYTGGPHIICILRIEKNCINKNSRKLHYSEILNQHKSPSPHKMVKSLVIGRERTHFLNNCHKYFEGIDP